MIERFLSKLRGVRQAGNGWTSRCPAHDDHENSLSVAVGDDGRILLKCFAGCLVEQIVGAVGLAMRDLFPESSSEGPAPIRVEDLARDKVLPVEFLKRLGLEDRHDGVVIPYRLMDGTLAPRQRLRTALAAKDGSLWLFGRGKVAPYGLDRLPTVKDARFLILVEGESDCWTLWFHGFPALGIPGASMTGVLLAEHLRGLDLILLVQEPDHGGEEFLRGVGARLATIGWKGSLRVVRLEGATDPNELHQHDPTGFRVRFQATLDAAVAHDLRATKRTERDKQSQTDTVLNKLTDGLTPQQLDAALRELAASLDGADALCRQITRQTAIQRLKDMGIGAPAKLVDAALGTAAAASRESDTLLLVDPEPCSDPVDGESLANDLRAIVNRHVVLPRFADAAIALWILFTYCVDAMFIAPILAITSPLKRCGKTTLLTLIANLVPRSLSASSITPAAVFRTIDRYHPTFVIDEADTFISKNDELRGIINSGHTRATASVIRTVGDDHEPKVFSTWCARTIALIGRLPGTLEDRSILVSMRRRAPGEKVKKLRLDRVANDCDDLRARAARWAADHLDELRDLEPPVPEALDDRAQDNWRPLLAIAEMIGGEWTELGRQAALALSAGRDEADQSAGIQVLSDLRDLFQSRRVDRLSSDDIVAALTRLEDRPWAESNRGKQLTKNQLASLLRKFEIRSRSIRIGEVTAKGYRMEDCRDTFVRYLPSETSQRNKSMESGTCGDLETSQGPRCDVSESEEKARKDGVVTPVTFRTPEPGEQADLFPPDNGPAAPDRDRFNL